MLDKLKQTTLLTTGSTIMVADYCEDTRDVLRFWLETRGCRVVEAKDGRQAVELCKQECPDLILMSMRMPVLSGLGATMRIRQRGPDGVFPIVAMSTYPTKKEKATALAAGCTDFMSQPIDFEVLSKVLNSLLPETEPVPHEETTSATNNELFSFGQAHMPNVVH